MIRERHVERRGRAIGCLSTKWKIALEDRLLAGRSADHGGLRAKVAIDLLVRPETRELLRRRGDEPGELRPGGGQRLVVGLVPVRIPRSGSLVATLGRVAISLRHGRLLLRPLEG